MGFTFVPAKKESLWVKLAIAGPSGSGKTYSALRLAKGLADGKQIAVIDTENRSASCYAGTGKGEFEFQVLNLDPPFTPERYIDAINAAVQAGFTVIIIDSLTHEWEGEGGLLEVKEMLDKTGRGNSYTNWNTIKTRHKKFLSRVTQSHAHLICTMRSKTEYVVESGDAGKSTPRKIGMAPIQQADVEYEFSIMFDVDPSHNATTNKDRTGIFTDEIGQITEQHGERLLTWLAGGAPMTDDQQAPAILPDNTFRRELISAISKMPKAEREDWKQYLVEQFDTDSIKELSEEQCQSMLTEIANSVPFGENPALSADDTGADDAEVHDNTEAYIQTSGGKK